MKMKLPAVLAFVGVALAIAACGGYNTSGAVDSINKQLNDRLQTTLQAAGAPASVTSQLGITAKCPDSVEKGKVFDCTVTGKASGKTVTVPMEINDSNDLVPAKQAEFNQALQDISQAEATQVNSN